MGHFDILELSFFVLMSNQKKCYAFTDDAGRIKIIFITGIKINLLIMLSLHLG